MSIEATDVERIAEGLTEAQHTALWNLGCGEPDFAHGWRRAPFDGWRRAGQACTNLSQKGLAEKEVEDHAVMYRLTPLGLAVRSHLMKGQDHD